MLYVGLCGEGDSGADGYFLDCAVAGTKVEFGFIRFRSFTVGFGAFQSECMLEFGFCRGEVCSHEYI